MMIQITATNQRILLIKYILWLINLKVQLSFHMTKVISISFQNSINILVEIFKKKKEFVFEFKWLIKSSKKLNI